MSKRLEQIQHATSENTNKIQGKAHNNIYTQREATKSIPICEMSRQTTKESQTQKNIHRQTTCKER